jgi:hypothetical protein
MVRVGQRKVSGVASAREETFRVPLLDGLPGPAVSF